MRYHSSYILYLLAVIGTYLFLYSTANNCSNHSLNVPKIPNLLYKFLKVNGVCS